MRRLIGSVFVLALAAGLMSSSASAQMGGPYGTGSGGGKSGNKVILSFKTMYGVNGPFVGATTPLRDVVGDDSPWIVKSVSGSLTSRGKLTINVKGLVFADAPNDEPTFRALVSCLAVNTGAVVTTNVISDPFPATMNGNSKIKAQLSLPQPCVAPIVMILAGSEDKWFAATGF